MMGEGDMEKLKLIKEGASVINICKEERLVIEDDFQNFQDTIIILDSKHGMVASIELQDLLLGKKTHKNIASLIKDADVQKRIIKAFVKHSNCDKLIVLVSTHELVKGEYFFFKEFKPDRIYLDKWYEDDVKYVWLVYDKVGNDDETKITETKWL